MTLRRLAVLQWFGFLAGGVVWWGSFLAGAGTSQATCNPGSGRWGIPFDGVELALLVFAVVLIGSAQAAAVAVFRATREVEEDEGPPHGRLHFFSIGAMLGNTIFLVIILLSMTAAIVDRACHQA